LIEHVDKFLHENEQISGDSGHRIFDLRFERVCSDQIALSASSFSAGQ